MTFASVHRSGARRRPPASAPTRSPGLLHWLTSFATILAGGVATGCGGGAVVDNSPPATLVVTYEGRPERGLSIILRASGEDGETLAPGTVAWRVDPARAGSWRGDTLDLEEAGKVKVTAEYDDEVGTLSLEIAAPPEILLDMAVAGNRDIYRVALDGRGLERLTTHPAEDYDPTVAGGRIVFVSERDGNPELYSRPLTGGSETRLTRTSAAEKHPVLSPDGKRLAFVRGAPLTRLFVADPDAGNPTRPDPTHGHDGTLEVAPAWSPDGRTLAFVSTAAGLPGIFTWSGDKATLLEFSGDGDFEPAWSPDGRRIAFASNSSGDVELYVLDLETREIRRLTEREGSDGYPTWLPDGRIVYVAFTETTPELRWLDPEDPGVSYRIPLPGEPGNPVALPPS